MIGLFVSAAILGLIIAVMEGEFPGWGNTILCVLAAAIPAFIVDLMLPDFYGVPGAIVGAICAGLAISALTGMTVKRATIAADIYFLVSIAIGVVFGMMIGRSRTST
jgi:hypothetical protein